MSSAEENLSNSSRLQLDLEDNNASWTPMKHSASAQSFSDSNAQSDEWHKVVRFLEIRRSETARSLDKELAEQRRYFEQLQRAEVESMENSSLRSQMQQQEAQFVLKRRQKLQNLQQLDEQIKQLRQQLGSVQQRKADGFSDADGIHLRPNPTLSGFAGLLSEEIDRSQSSSNSWTKGCHPPASASMISFTSSMEAAGAESARSFDLQNGAKADMVESLLSLLDSHDRVATSQTLLVLSKSRETCQIMRDSGCVQLLVQLLHAGDIWAAPPAQEEVEVLHRATAALHNLTAAQPDADRARRDGRILRCLEKIRAYVGHLRLVLAGAEDLMEDVCEKEILPALATLKKMSFDGELRHSTSQLGGLQAMAELLVAEELLFGRQFDATSLALRRYVGMTLTNLTFGDSANKATLCRQPRFLTAVNSQIESDSEDLRQVFSSVLRNLSWKADSRSKKALRDAKVVSTLCRTAMRCREETSLKATLSALWNLSSHCSENKADICALPGALEFLVSTLSYKSAAGTTAVVENGGGVLRNVSSQIALREDFRQRLRQHNCLPILLAQLKSASLTIVSNACGTLWNLSARNLQDQRSLWELGAVPMLKSLIHSKHRMISTGSSATLKNLLAAKPPANAVGAELSQFGPLRGRKLKALESELDANLAEICHDPNDSPKDSPTHRSNLPSRLQLAQQQLLRRGEQNPQEIRKTTQQPGKDGQMTWPHAQMRIGGPSSFSPFSEASSCGLSLPHSQTTGAMEMSKSNEMQRSSTSAKEERLQQDKLAVQRLHHSLNRRRKVESSSIQPDYNTLSHQADDTDRPTNFSQKYGERESLSKTASSRCQTDFPSPIGPNKVPVASDTFDDFPQSYCVEGTPLISHAGSLSDLRGGQDDNNSSRRNSFGPQSQLRAKVTFEPRPVVDSIKECPDSPGSPVQTYATEGTPFNYTRAASTDSLTDAVEDQLDCTTIAASAAEPKVPATPQLLPEMTPMMFSRQSSVTSLDSCDQHSIRSNVASDYSQNPTGLMSPAELPESPGHTEPPSPAPERRIPHSTSQTHFAPPQPPISSVPSAQTIPSVSSRMKTDFDDVQPYNTCASRDEQPHDYADEFDADKLSICSGLSGLTLGSEKIRTAAEIVGVVTERHQSVPIAPTVAPPVATEDDQLLQDCISAAMPSKKSTVRRPHHQPASKPAEFKVPPVPVDLDALIQSAMPKTHSRPSTSSHHHRGKSVAVATPIPHRSDVGRQPAPISPASSKQQSAASAQPTASGVGQQRTSAIPVFCVQPFAETFKGVPGGIQSELPTVWAEEGTPANFSRRSSLSDVIADLQQKIEEKSEAIKSHSSAAAEAQPSDADIDDQLLQDCIYAVMPKLDKKPTGKLAAKPPSIPNSPQRLRQQLLLTSGRGILETSGISLIQSDMMMGISHVSSTLDGQMMPDDLLFISGCTNDSPRHLPLTPQHNRHPTTAKSAELMTRSDASESLSEDNYDQPDNFDIRPEDVDLSLLEADANDVLLQMQTDGNNADDYDEEILLAEEMLIDCESISLVSNTSSAMSRKSISEEENFGQSNNRRPKIVKSATSTTCEIKMVRGGVRRSLTTTSSAPKMAVRTTKTAQLRARHTSSGSGEEQKTPVAPQRISSGRSSAKSSCDRLNRLSSGSGSLSQAEMSSTGKSPDGSSVTTSTATTIKANDSKVKPKPVVPPKPSWTGANSQSNGRRSLGKNVSSKIASLWRKDPAEPAIVPKESSPEKPAVRQPPPMRSSMSPRANNESSSEPQLKSSPGKTILITTV